MQLDIFDDSDNTARRNDVVQAVERRDAAAARQAWRALVDVYPADDARQPLALLVDALEQGARTDAFGDDAAGRDALRRAAGVLQNAVEPAARRLLGGPAAGAWLKPLWRQLAQRAAGLPWRVPSPRCGPRGGGASAAASGQASDAVGPDLVGPHIVGPDAVASNAVAGASRLSDGDDSAAHAAPLWLRAGDWQAAADAVGRIESWRRIPAPLAWMAEARCRQHGLDGAWPLLAELAWLAPSRFDRLSSALGDPLLARLRRAFGAAFDGDGTVDDWAWFPAWLLTEQPALAPRLAAAQPSRHTAPESAMRLLVELLGLERQGRHHDVVARRQVLRDVHAGLYAAYLRTPLTRSAPRRCRAHVTRPPAGLETVRPGTTYRFVAAADAPKTESTTTMNTALRSSPTPRPGSGRALPARLTVARVLTGLLEHLEASRKPVDPGQYQLVARRLADELATLPPDPMMDAWMRGHPLAAELYENGVYGHAGLCRQPLDAALIAELAAKAAIAQAGRGARSAAP